MKKQSKTEIVLALLKKRPSKGVSVRDFPNGFRLASYIHNLRRKGHIIETHQKHITDIARYVLKPKSADTVSA